MRALIATALAAVLAAPPALAASELDRSRERLGDLRTRIGELNQGIAEAEQDRAQADRALEAAARALAESARALRETQARHRQTLAELERLAAEGTRLRARIERRREDVADWLRRHHRSGHDARLADIVVSRDPNQLARDAHYLQLIGRANLAVLAEQRADLEQLQGLAAAQAEQERTQARLADEQRRQQAATAQARAVHRAELAAIDRRLREQRSEHASLRLNEQQLGKLISRLEHQRAEESRRRASSAENTARRAAPEPGRSGDSPSTRGGARIERGDFAAPAGTAFRKLKGRLSAPVSGELLARFGSARSGGGPAWKGVFIRAAEGQEVRAVAAGEVVFADWLRGFGNLVIVDHGEGFLSIYGNNETILPRVGQRVTGGEAIASVGASEEQQGSGLYFEIRHLGEPVDPLDWVAGR